MDSPVFGILNLNPDTKTSNQAGLSDMSLILLRGNQIINPMIGIDGPG